MTDFERLFIGGGIGLLIGSGTLIVGLAIMKQRPVVVSYKSIKIAIPLVSLPLLIMDTFWLVSESLASDPDISYLILLLRVLLITLTISTLWIFLIPRVCALYNVTNTIVISCLDEVFQKHRIEYVIEETKNPINQGLRISQVTVIFPKLDSSIKVTLSVLGVAWLWFRGWRRVSKYKAILNDFADALLKHKCSTSFMIGVQFALMGIGAIGIVLYALFDKIL